MIYIEKELAAIPIGFPEKLEVALKKQRQTGGKLDLSDFSLEELEYLKSQGRQMAGEIKALKEDGVTIGPPTAGFFGNIKQSRQQIILNKIKEYTHSEKIKLWLNQLKPSKDIFYEISKVLGIDKKETGAFGMLLYLWKKTPPNLRDNLIEEFLFRQNDLRNRYLNEEKFKDDLDNNWH